MTALVDRPIPAVRDRVAARMHVYPAAELLEPDLRRGHLRLAGDGLEALLQGDDLSPSTRQGLAALAAQLRGDPMNILKRILEQLKPRYVFRDAVTGKFVTRAYAEQNPDTTIRQRI